MARRLTVRWQRLLGMAADSGTEGEEQPYSDEEQHQEPSVIAAGLERLAEIERERERDAGRSAATHRHCYATAQQSGLRERQPGYHPATPRPQRQLTQQRFKSALAARSQVAGGGLGQNQILWHRLSLRWQGLLKQTIPRLLCRLPA